MGALLEDYRRGLYRVGPVAAAVGVGDLEESDTLLVGYRNHIAKLARIYYRLYVRKVASVAKHVSGDYEKPLGRRLFDDLATLGLLCSDWLFEKKMVAEVQGRHRSLVVERVRKRDEHGVGIGPRG